MQCKDAAVNRLLTFSVLSVFFAMSAGQAEDTGFAFSRVENMARDLAASPYKAADDHLPRNLRNLEYDDLRNIRFDPRAALWRMERLPFQLQFFHPGGLQKDRIQMNWFEGELMEEVHFSKDFFDYEKVRIRGSLPDDLGFAGFRVHYPMNRPDYLDEVIVFQGASYFRALAEGQHYGLSARGLAINVAGETPEEFPRFISYWVEKPDRTSTRLRLFALMDSPSVAGAYEFTVMPGLATLVDVKAVLYARVPLERAGVAPLTSMFWFGENSPTRYGDFRPEVHDTDGLIVFTGAGEWLWRPLVNESRYRFSSFVDHNPRGFGLVQRDRQFQSYEDLEAFYHKRPSIWVEPTSEWGGGEIRLVEIPTTTEYEDNIVAFWTPREPLMPGEPREFSYRLHWYNESGIRPPKARTLSTRIGDITYMPGAKKFVLDFGNHPLLDEAGVEGLEADVSASNGKVLGKFIQHNELNNTWRVFFDVEPVDRAHPVEMRCFIRNSEQPLSETWTYLWIP